MQARCTGFITIGQILGYDGMSFQATDKFDAKFRTMRSQEKDCLNYLEMVLLNSGYWIGGVWGLLIA